MNKVAKESWYCHDEQAFVARFDQIAKTRLDSWKRRWTKPVNTPHGREWHGVKEASKMEVEEEVKLFGELLLHDTKCAEGGSGRHYKESEVARLVREACSRYREGLIDLMKRLPFLIAEAQNPPEPKEKKSLEQRVVELEAFLSCFRAVPLNPENPWLTDKNAPNRPKEF